MSTGGTHHFTQYITKYIRSIYTGVIKNTLSKDIGLSSCDIYDHVRNPSFDPRGVYERDTFTFNID